MPLGTAQARSPGTMRGWAIRAYGEAMVLIDEPSVATPGPHDIVMEMRSAEAGDWDVLVRSGTRMGWILSGKFWWIRGGIEPPASCAWKGFEVGGTMAGRWRPARTRAETV
jgi:hypothetical protein